MAKKIEQFLRVVGDLHRFERDNPADSSPFRPNIMELFEDDLDLVSAAAQIPQDVNLPSSKDC